MEQEQDWFEAMFEPADAGTPAVDEAATEAAAPEDDASPVADTEDAVLESAPVEEVEAEAPEPEQPAQPPPTPEIDWNRPELVAMRQKAERLEQFEQAVVQAQRLKQQQDLQNQITEWADGDPERLQQINGTIAQVVTPVVQQAQAFQRRAESVEKTASAMWIAMQAHLDESQIAAVRDEVEALMSVEGVEVMQRAAFGKRDAMRTHQAEVAARDARIRELELQIASQGQLAERERTGADLVDGGGGGPPLDRVTRMREAQTFDDYWSGMTGRA